MSDMAVPTALVRKANRTSPVHYWLTLLMAVALVPLLRVAGLPYRLAWAQFFQYYWAFILPECIVGGLILYLAGSPVSESLGPLYRRCMRQKLRYVFLLALSVILIWTLGVVAGLITTLTAIVLLEAKDRAEENHLSLLKMASDIFWPTTYVFVGGVIVSAYNEAIAAMRYNGAAEITLKAWDAFLLGGNSVSAIAHAFIGRWPASVSWLEFIYFGTFAQTGGTLAFLAVKEGRSRALKYVGTVLIAFYAAVVCFYLWPATGPYASCVGHFTVVPNGPIIYYVQHLMVGTLDRIRSGVVLSAIGPDYFVALPSMHLVQALISLWFLRERRRLFILVTAFDILLVPAILLLENHYLVDLIAAVPVAVLAIAISGRDDLVTEAGGI